MLQPQSCTSEGGAAGRMGSRAIRIYTHSRAIIFCVVPMAMQPRACSQLHAGDEDDYAGEAKETLDSLMEERFVVHGGVWCCFLQTAQH